MAEQPLLQLSVLYTIHPSDLPCRTPRAALIPPLPATEGEGGCMQQPCLSLMPCPTRFLTWAGLTCHFPLPQKVKADDHGSSFLKYRGQTQASE